MGKLLCRLGRHKWVFFGVRPTRTMLWVFNRCERCDQRRAIEFR